MRTDAGMGSGRTGSTNCRPIMLVASAPGVRIDPPSLHVEAGFNRDGDPNCCPSQRLMVELELRGDSLLCAVKP
jgi:hypothetical protein